MAVSFASPADTVVSYQHASEGVEEILRPTLVISGGLSYRKLTDIEFGRRPTDRNGKTRRREERSQLVEEDQEKLRQRYKLPSGEEKQQCSEGPMETQKPYNDDMYDEGDDIETVLKGIEKMRNGNYRLKLPIPSVFFKYIIGKEGRTKKGIERDTECRLWLPSKGREGDVGRCMYNTVACCNSVWCIQMILVIEGLTQSNVADAKRRVEIIVWTNRDKERPTHFISIPLTQAHIKDRVAEFKSTALEMCRGVIQ